MADYILMIALSPTMEEGTIQKWNKKKGDTINSGDIICEVETDKANMEYEMDEEGVLLAILVPEGGKARVGEPIAIMGEEGEEISGLMSEKTTSSLPAPEKAEEKVPEQPAREKMPNHRGDRIKSSPLARKLAKKNSIDLSRLSGSGPGNRIIKKDIDAYLAGRKQPEVLQQKPVVTTSSGKDIILPLSRKREIIARRLSESKFQAPHYYLKIKVNADALMESRKRINGGLTNHKISFNAFLIKLVANALKKHPRINSSWQGDSILQFGSVDIGLAVAVNDGLITPVVRNSGNKGIMEIEDNVKDLLGKAGESRLGPDEINGATFTISNLGSSGIDDFTAIINPPGSAILAVGKVSREPVVAGEDKLEIKNVMRLSLSCDHRVIDGAVGAAFLKTLKEMIENPMAALL